MGLRLVSSAPIVQSVASYIFYEDEVPLFTHSCKRIPLMREIDLPETDPAVILWISGGYWSPLYQLGERNDADKHALAKFLDHALRGRFYISEVSHGLYENLHLVLSDPSDKELCDARFQNTSWLRGSFFLPRRTSAPSADEAVQYNDLLLHHLMRAAALSLAEPSRREITREQISGVLRKVVGAKSEPVG